MERWRVRYHRAILGNNREVLFPPGAILDDISKVDPAQHDKLIVFDDGVPLVKATVTVKPAAKNKDKDEEC